jgi:hypothetical protein
MLITLLLLAIMHFIISPRDINSSQVNNSNILSLTSSTHTQNKHTHKKKKKKKLNQTSFSYTTTPIHHHFPLIHNERVSQGICKGRPHPTVDYNSGLKVLGEVYVHGEGG